MNIDGVVNGYVLDHIHQGSGMQIYKILQLDKLECSVAIIQNALSEKLGKKDIIKIDEIIELDFDILGYIDPNITVNRVEGGKLKSKVHLSLPATVVDLIKCKNPRCITSSEIGIEHCFKLKNADKKLYRCIYCDAENKEKK